ncbi:MAG: TetR/AcrR family transcriptional regulator [Herpetosiphonaceae bacterium]|nr:TetR/AcrR family transcriptional regulator [Herpetosiphonaceae bacterium]
MVGQPVSRRERYRAETREEAKGIALRQLAEGGTGAVSLNAIGKEMGITGPALYRYFASRDALLTEIIIDAYSDLAAATEVVAARQGDDVAPQERLRALAEVIRAWALTQPHRYLLLYGTPVPGYVAPDDTVPLARRVLVPFLDALSALPVMGAIPGSRLAVLEAQLATWVRATDPHMVGPVFRRGLVWWTRLHGLISLEVEGHFASMGFDPALLYDTEIDALLDG